MKLTGAKALQSLEMEGVEVMFGFPVGSASCPTTIPWGIAIRHILVRHNGRRPHGGRV